MLRACVGTAAQQIAQMVVFGRKESQEQLSALDYRFRPFGSGSQFKREFSKVSIHVALSFEGIRLAIDANQRVRIHLDLQGDMSLGLGATGADIRRLRDACDELLAQIDAGGDAAH